MPLRFGPYLRDENSPRPRRAAPDYNSRGVRFRLWMLVGMVMLVLTLMVEARKPKHYEWMWRNDRRQESEPTARSAPPSKTPSRGKPVIPLSPEQVPGTNRSAANRTPENLPSLDIDLLARTRKEGWTRLFDQIPAAEREAGHDLLYLLLRASRANAELNEEERRQGAILVPRLDHAQTAYRTEAAAAIANLPAADQPGWQSILEVVDREWNGEILPALQSLVDGRRLDSDQRRALNQLQGQLDELALEAIQDNTVPNRSVERHAWFRLFETLAGVEEPELRKLSLGHVGYVQLLKQPKDYRGKLVTVKGTVQLGYRVSPPENVEGIKQYYVFWLKPIGGDDSPIVVYALETPEGFPPVLDKDVNQEVNRLNVDAEFTGYFFKRMAYLSKKDTLTTPLILARAPHFDHRWAPDLGPGQGPPSAKSLLPIVGGTGLAALAIAFVILFLTRRRTENLHFPEEISASDLRRLEAQASANQTAPRPQGPPADN